MASTDDDIIASVSPMRRRLTLASLYFAEGAPIGFVYWYLNTRLGIVGVPNDRIGWFVGLLVLPWTFKFLWAPAIDALGRSRVGYRFCVIGAQCLMALSLLSLITFDWLVNLNLLFVLVFAHSLCAATQDVAIDAWMIRLTPEHERSRVTAWMQAGFRMSMWLFGYGVLMLGDRIGVNSVVIALSATILALTSISFLLPEPRRQEAAEPHEPIGTLILEMLRRRTTWLGLAFALTGGAGFEAVGSSLGRFYRTHGMGESMIGMIATASILGIVPGGFIGGYLADRYGRLKLLAASGVWIAISIFALILVPYASNALLATSGFCLYLGIGAFTTSSYALFIDLTDRRLGGTQFSLYMGATNGCESWSAILVGTLIVRFGWPVAFSTLAVIGLFSLVWLILIHIRTEGRSESTR